jgi:hypothetical protein
MGVTELHYIWHHKQDVSKLFSSFSTAAQMRIRGMWRAELHYI